MRYSIIYHNIRNAAGLSLVDYCLLDAIYMLSTSNLERYKGWCNASKSSFDHITSVRNITKRYNVLEANGWLEFKGENRYLKRTTEKYYREVRIHIERVNKVPTNKEQSTPLKELYPPMNKVHPPHEQSTCLEVNKVHPPHEQSTPNNNIDNKRDNNIDKERKGKDKLSPVSSKELSQEEYLGILEKAAATVGAKNQPSEKEKKLREKKKKQELPEIPMPEGFLPEGYEPPLKPWYQEQLDELVELEGYKPHGNWEGALRSKKIEHWGDELKKVFVKWVFNLAAKAKYGVTALAVGENINDFLAYLKTGEEPYLIQALNLYVSKNWTNWRKTIERIKKDEQRINNRQGQQQGGNNLPDYSIYSQPIDIDD